MCGKEISHSDFAAVYYCRHQVHPSMPLVGIAHTNSRNNSCIHRYARSGCSIADWSLSSLEGADGLMTLLEAIYARDWPSAPTHEVIKRLYVPHYEMARFIIPTLPESSKEDFGIDGFWYQRDMVAAIKEMPPARRDHVSDI